MALPQQMGVRLSVLYLVFLWVFFNRFCFSLTLSLIERQFLLVMRKEWQGAMFPFRNFVIGNVISGKHPQLAADKNIR